MGDDRAQAIVLQSRIWSPAMPRPWPRAAPNPRPICARSPERFINRELSWLHFNRRVLEEAENPQPSAVRAGPVPVDLGQQPRRILHGPRRRPQGAGARRHHRPRARTASRPASSLRASARRCRASPATSRRAGASCARSSRPRTSCWSKADSLKKADRTWLEDYFLQYIFPVLTPLAIDPAHPFPFIPNLGFSIAFQLARTQRRQGDERADPRAAEDRALHPLAGAPTAAPRG